MESLDPFSFNAIRFALGALFVWIVAGRKYKGEKNIPWLLGLVLFVAATLQQVGIMFTSAGSAGFITGLYVVIVPVFGLFRGHKLKPQIIAAVLMAITGLFLINRPGNLEVSLGNFLVLISAFFWAWHVQMVDFYGKKYAVAYLAFSQFAICASLNLIAFLVYYLFKQPAYIVSVQLGSNLLRALWPILYGGLLSVGIAYSLQIKAQQTSGPSKAAVILCLEGVFALFGGWLVLAEVITLRMLIGVAFMLTAMLLSLVPKVFD